MGLGLNAALLAFFLTRPHPAAPPVTPPPPAPVATVPATSPARPLAPASTIPPSAAPAPATSRRESTGKSAAPELPATVAKPTPLPSAPAPTRKEPAQSAVTPGSVTLAPAPEPVPLLETLSAGARRGIPALNLDIHVHSADPDRRFVVINGRRYREGDRLGEGPVLETVTRDGAILRQGGQRFRLSVRR